VREGPKPPKEGERVQTDGKGKGKAKTKWGPTAGESQRKDTRMTWGEKGGSEAGEGEKH